MSSEVWYRKWRPQTFADVAGQAQVTRTLARAVALDRVAHAYLFCGPRGTGKTSTARILAKAVNCAANEDGQPCNRCDSCTAVAAGRALDLVEMDAASNRGIDEIRSLRERVGYSPNSARYKVYLIDEVHELTQFAFDALLKTLEEPPPHVIFVLATTEAHRVPETIVSRCQRFDFVRIKLADVVGRLRQIASAEGVEASDAVLSLIARRATGSLRDGVNLLEQAVAIHGRSLTESDVRSSTGAGDARSADLAAHMLARRLAEALDLVAAVRDDGIDLRQFARDAVQALRSALLLRAGASASLELAEEALQAVQPIADSSTVVEILRALRLLTAADFRADPQASLPLELAIVEFAANAPAGPDPRAAEGAGVQRPRQSVAPSPVRAANTADRIRAAQAPRTGPRPTPLPSGEPAAANGSGTGDAGPALSGERERQAAAIVPDEEPPVVGSEGAAAAPGETVAGGDAAAIAAATQASPLSLDDARQRFREIYVRLREIDRGVAPVLNSAGCDIVSIDSAALVFGFKHEKVLERALRPTSMAALQQSVSDVFGEGINVSCRHEPAAADRMQILAAERPSHLLDEALKLGARPTARD